MIITNKLTIELKKPAIGATVYAVQDDRYSRNLELTLLSDGASWTVPSGTAALIRYSKPDGTGGEYDSLPDGRCAWEIQGNVLTLALAPQVFTAPGAVQLSVLLLQGNIQLSTFAVTICVEPAVNADGLQSEGYYPMYPKNREPAEEDIPKVFFGGPLPQTKDETIMPFHYISKTRDIRGYCKTKAQGNSSMAYPKKNQTVKLYRDADCTEPLKVHFKDWGPQHKFCLKANWIDLTHARNIVSARLWGDLVAARPDYTQIPELLQTSPNHGAVDGFPIKVYAQGIYQGRYTLNIPKDAWMANMDDALDTHCILCGEGYLSGCFREASTAQWTDEVHETMPDAIQSRWMEAISFVMNSTDSEFLSGIETYFDVTSLIDYYLFGLASCGLDAFGKNQLFMTYDGKKWYASMYDMDATWGLWWNGETFVPSSYSRTEYQDFKDGTGNLLFMRLESLFSGQIRQRWQVLKDNVLSVDHIINRFERFTDIAPAELVAEDYAATTANGSFSGIPSQTSNTLARLRSFIAERLAWTEHFLNGESEEESDILYTLSGPTVFDGATVCIDTGVKLFDTAKDFTIFLQFEGTAPASEAYGYLLSADTVENLEQANLQLGYEGGVNQLKLRASGNWDHSWEDVDDGSWGHIWDNVCGAALVFVDGIFSFGQYLKKNDKTAPRYIKRKEGLTYSFAAHNDTLKIGARTNFWTGELTDFWTGTVNTLRLYNRAMPEAEVTNLLLSITE